VQNSLLMEGRPTRAQSRFAELKGELQSNKPSWKQIYELSWADFWDMHALFETSGPPFGYMKEESLQILSAVRNLWETMQDGPVATMDAGANVHLLWRADQEIVAMEFEREHSRFQCLSNLDGLSEGDLDVFN